VDRDERLKRTLLGPDATLGQALRAMSDSAARIVFVVEGERRLLGVLTDGDVRRWIIDGRSLDEPVSAAMNASPVTLPAGSALDDARELIVERRIECVPLLHEDGTLADAVWWLDLFETPRIEREHLGMPVAIMAGGQGSRLAPLTTILPKPLMPVGEKTILELIMERFADYGCDRFYVSVNYKANLIRAYVADIELPYRIEFVEESRPLGTAGSLSLLRDAIDSTFFLTNCDIAVDADYGDIVRFHRERENRVTIVASAKHFTIPYGVCETSAGGALRAMREKPEFDFLVSTGFYVVEPSVLGDVADDEFAHMTDVINRYLDEGERVGVYPVPEDSWIDIGEVEALRETLTRFGVG
jgi:dTDP-glucose pyrophosphorylase